MGSHKKKHKFLTIKEKCAILDELGKGVTSKALAQRYGVHKSTITQIKNRKSKIRKFVYETESGPGKRKTLKKAEYPEMEQALYKWFMTMRSRNVPISAEILKEKAKALHEKITGNTGGFTASSGWIDKFKSRHGIRLLKITGEKLSSTPQLIDPFLREFHKTLQNLNLDMRQVYNADESGLFYKLLPEKTLVHFKESSAPGRKKSKERITFLACTNATGSHKVTPLVIGKSHNPRAFKHFINPLKYKASKNAWMTTSIFEDWFKTMFIPEVRRFLSSEGLPLKAILLVDQAPCHPKDRELKSEDGQIVVMCLPANCTAILQPMDQNVINLVKLHYKKSLLSHLVALGSEDFEANMRKINLRDAVCFLYEAWEKLDSESIKKCWKPLSLNNEWSPEDEIPLSQLRQQLRSSSREILQPVQVLLNSISSEVEYRPEEVREWISERGLIHIHEVYEEDVNSSSSSESNSTEPKIKHEEAIQCLNKCLEWARQNCLPINDLIVLQQIREKAVNKNMEIVRQTKIDKFFKPILKY